jgi:hypothetical protein
VLGNVSKVLNICINVKTLLDRIYNAQQTKNETQIGVKIFYLNVSPN